jgi:hypothetical protein
MISARLSSMTTPLFLDRVLEPLSRCLTPEAAERLVLTRPDPQIQTRLAELAGKSAAVGLTGEERAEYEACLRTRNLIAILQAKARALLAAS